VTEHLATELACGTSVAGPPPAPQASSHRAVSTHTILMVVGIVVGVLVGLACIWAGRYEIAEQVRIFAAWMLLGTTAAVPRRPRLNAGLRQPLLNAGGEPGGVADAIAVRAEASV
jgi:hypothetical protein